MEVQKEINQISAVKLADYILKNFGPMSHLKLQKLIYYCEGYHLAFFNDRALVHENFEAWVHGPVCVDVYHLVKGASVLYSDVVFNQEAAGYDPNEYIYGALSSRQTELINDVLVNLSKWKDSELEAATHRETPWIEARAGIPEGQPSNSLINKITMGAYYRKEMNTINGVQ